MRPQWGQFTSMALTQTESDSLLAMTMQFADADPLEFLQMQPMRYARLISCRSYYKLSL